MIDAHKISPEIEVNINIRAKGFQMKCWENSSKTFSLITERFPVITEKILHDRKSSFPVCTLWAYWIRKLESIQFIRREIRKFCAVILQVPRRRLIIMKIWEEEREVWIYWEVLQAIDVYSGTFHRCWRRNWHAHISKVSTKRSWYNTYFGKFAI